jgi:hypothetical protein
MFGFLAKCFKRNFIDPLDKNPSILKTVRRVYESLLEFMKENSPLVWRGCAMSIIEILENVFPDKTINGGESVARVLIGPLLKV